jgi:hypothetical protein
MEPRYDTNVFQQEWTCTISSAFWISQGIRMGILAVLDRVLSGICILDGLGATDTEMVRPRQSAIT